MYIIYVYVLLRSTLSTPPVTLPRHTYDTTRHARTRSLSLNTPKALLALCPLDQLKLHNRPEWEF